MLCLFIKKKRLKYSCQSFSNYLCLDCKNELIKYVVSLSSLKLALKLTISSPLPQHIVCYLVCLQMKMRFIYFNGL